MRREAGGVPITRAQEEKAAKYLEMGLVRFERLVERDRLAGILVNQYVLHPLPGNKAERRVTHEQRRVGGQVRILWACDCQAWRGTKTSRPRDCSHILAVRRIVYPHLAERAK